MAENIYPIYDRMMTRQDKESLLGQRGFGREMRTKNGRIYDPKSAVYLKFGLVY